MERGRDAKGTVTKEIAQAHLAGLDEADLALHRGLCTEDFLLCLFERKRETTKD